MQLLLAELSEMDEAAFRLMTKFHRQTKCGSFVDGSCHWAECERFVDAMGYESWEHWQASHEAVVSGDTGRLEALLNGAR